MGIDCRIQSPSVSLLGSQMMRVILSRLNLLVFQSRNALVSKMQGSSIIAENLHFLGCTKDQVNQCKSLAKVLPSTGSPDRTRSHQCMDEQLLSHSWRPRSLHW